MATANSIGPIYGAERAVNRCRSATNFTGVPMKGESSSSADVAKAKVPDDETIVYISPLAYLRSVIAILWTSLRHPFMTSAVDLTTGKIVRISSDPFTAEDFEE